MPKTLESIKSQTQAEKSKVQDWQSGQRRSVEEEARRVREEIKEQISQTEKEAQEILEATRRARVKEAKKLELGLKPETEQYDVRLERVEKQRKDIVSKGYKARKELEKSEKEALAEVEKTVSEALEEIDKASKEAIAEYEGFKKDNVELDYENPETKRSEWMDKEAFDELSKEDQKLIMKVGVEEFNKVKEKKFKETHIQLDTDEYVTKDLYKGLSKEDQEYLDKHGIEKYNDYLAEKQYGQYKKLAGDKAIAFKDWGELSGDERAKLYSDIVSEKYVTLSSTGELIDRETFDKLPPEQQARLNEQGIEGYNSWLSGNFTTLSTGEMIDNTTFHSLDKELQDILMAEGFAGYDEYIKENYKTLDTGELVPRDWYEGLPGKTAEDRERRNYLRENGLEAYYKKYFVTLDTGELVDIDWFNSLTKEQRAEVSTKGHDQYMKDNYITLGTGEIVGKEFYDGLAPIEQNVLMAEGVGRWESDFYVELDNGEMVDKLTFNGLPEEHQAILQQHGIIYYETWAGAEQLRLYEPITVEGEIEWVDKDWYNSLAPVKKSELKNKGYDQFIDDNYVTLSSTGELMLRENHTDELGNLVTGFDELSLEDKNFLQTQGIEAFNKMKQGEFEKEMEKYVELDNGDLVIKENFDALSIDDRKLLRSVGVAQFNQVKDKEVEDFIASLPPEAQDWITEHGIEDFNTWLEKAETETDERAFVITQNLGLIPKGAVFVGKNEKGELEFTAPPKPVDLEALDWDNLTGKDFAGIVVAVSDMAGEKYPSVIGKAYVAWFTSQTPEHQEILYRINQQAYLEKMIDIVSFVFPPAQALKADITLADITAIDWAIGAASIALIVATPALGAIGKLAGVTGKVVSTIGKTAVVASRIVQAGAVATFSVVTAVEWKDMTPTQRAIAVALNVAIVGAIYGKVFTRGLKAIAGKVKGMLSEATKTINKLSRAVKAGNVAKIKSLSQELEAIGSKMLATNPVEARIIMEQARFFHANASAIARQGVKMPGSSAKLLRQINKDIVRLTKTGASGGQVSKLPKEIFGKADIKSSPITKMSPRVKTIAIDWNKILRQQQVKTAFETLGKSIRRFAPDEAPFGRGGMYGYLDRPSLPASSAYKARMGKAWKSGQELAWEAQSKEYIRGAIEKVTGKTLPAVEREKLVSQIYQATLGQVTGDASGLVLKTLQQMMATDIWKPALITKLTKAQIEKLIAQWGVMSPGKALQQMMSANMVTIAIATNTSAVISIITKADVKLQNKVKAIVSPKLGEAIEQAIRTDVSLKVKSANLTEARTIASTDVKVATEALAKVSEQMEQLAKTVIGVEALTQTQVKTRTLAETKAITKAVTEAVTKTVTETTTKTQIETQVQQAVETQVKQITNVAVREAVKTKVDSIVGIVTAKIARIKQIVSPKVPKLPIIKLPDGTSRSMTKEEMEGAVAWKQGFIYIMIYPPYKPQNIQYSRKPFPGIRVVKGARSAYETIVKLGQKIPSRLAYDMGIMDIEIITQKAGRGKPRLKFKADPKQKTKQTGISVAR